MKQVKVLYIGGYSRSGSTLFLRLLGQVDGCFAVGEMWDLWQRNFIENHLCGCGLPFKTCKKWQAVIKEAFGGFDQVDVVHMQNLREAVHGHRAIPMLLLPWLRTPKYKAQHTEYVQILGKLYCAIQKVAESRVIVDSSKVPTYAYLLSEVPEIDLHVMHLVRDSRATAYSWQRKKVRPEIHWKTAYMERHSVSRSALEWNIMNGLFQSLQRTDASYMRLRYEKLVADPRQTLWQIESWLGESQSDLAFFEDATSARLRLNHTVSGNPNRFKQGLTQIRSDTEWQRKMPRRQQWVVQALSWPLLRAYGYKQKGKKPFSRRTNGELQIGNSGL